MLLNFKRIYGYEITKINLQLHFFHSNLSKVIDLSKLVENKFFFWFFTKIPLL